MAELGNPQLIAAEYKPIIAAFRKRADVQNGTALAYKGSKDIADFSDTPKGIGDGLGTTGWCVSASNALLIDPAFQLFVQSRSAKAKLISIDIKEQYYGQCYTGSQNKWHTAIFLEDSGVNLIIDITCRQFGNSFIGKDIWDFKTWEKTFRSANCKHKITDFNDNPMSVIPIPLNYTNKELTETDMVNKLHDVISISDAERGAVAKFVVEDMELFNKKLLIGNVNKFDYAYIKNINEIFEHFPFKILKDNICILQFETKEASQNWFKKLHANGYVLQQYLVASSSFIDNCKFYAYNSEKINKRSLGNAEHYLILEFPEIAGVDFSAIDNASIMLPYGTKITIEEGSIMNGGVKNNAGNQIVAEPLNTTYLKVLVD